MSTSEIQAEPSVHTADGHESGSGPELPPARQGDNTSDAKKLRALMRQKGVDSTTSLVRIYNGSLTAEAERLLQQCLRIYGETKEEHVNADKVIEYAELCKMKPRTEDDKELLRDVVFFLSDWIPSDKFAAKGVAEALYRSLLWTPPAIFQQDLAKLTALADKLTASLRPKPKLTEANFLEHEATFMALHQVFVLMQSIARGRMSMKEKKSCLFSLRKKWLSMEESYTYYPVRHYFTLIEQSIQRLKLDEETSFAQQTIQFLQITIRWFLYIPATHLFLYTFLVTRQLVKCDIDPDAFRELLKKLKELVANVDAAERQWYDLLLDLSVAGRKAVEDRQELEIFEESYKAVIESVWKTRLGEDGRALLFGLMQELRHLALAQCSAEVRASGSSKLFALADAVTKSVWVKDEHIVEALLCCLHAVHSRGNDDAAAMRSSQQLIDAVKSDAVKKAVKQWMGNKLLDEKLREPVYASSEPTGDLFTAIGREFNHIPFTEAQDNVELLKSRYRSDAFATIVASKKESSELADLHKSRDDQSTGRRVAHSIALEDLFKKRVVKEDRPAQDIRAILFHGNPGSGKTCISKYIGYMWATGRLFEEFEAVYVLPARELNTKEDIEGPSEEFLAFILRQCFPRYREFDKGLCAQVDDHLDLQKTLLVIDGWDEVDEKAAAILNEAKRRQCRVLWLTRPYNLLTMRELTDLEVECLGFSDEQVDRYVKKEMATRHEKTEAEARGLLDALRGTDSLWEVAHIPVMTYILCFLWVERARLRGRSPASMFYDMVNCIWDRFIQKEGDIENPRRPEVFEALEVVAFDALREDHTLISVRFVAKRVSHLEVREVLRQSGFLLFKKEEVDYQFSHPSFRKYFAERWVAKSLKNTDSEEGKTARKFLREEKYLNRYKRTLQFLAQHLAEMQEVDGLSKLLSFLDEGPIEIIGLQHLLLKLYIVEAWLMELQDAKSKKDCCDCEAVASLIEASISLIRDTDVKHREFGEILGRMLHQCPLLFSAVPKMLDQLTGATTVRKALRYGVFGDIVIIAKRSDKHLTMLIQLTEQNIQSSEPETRDVGIEAMRDLLNFAPDLFRKFMPLLERTCSDDNVHVRQWSMEAVGHLASAAPDLAPDILSFVEKGCSDEDEHVRLWALKAVSKVTTAAPQLAENLLPLLRNAYQSEDTHVLNREAEALRDFTSAAPHLADHVPTRGESEEASDAPSSTGLAPVSQGAVIDDFEDVLKKAIETKNPKIRERAAFGLLQDTVTVEDAPSPGYVRVLLHTTAIREVGDYPSGQIEDFRSGIRETIKSSCSGLLEVLDKVAIKPDETA